MRADIKEKIVSTVLEWRELDEKEPIPSELPAKKLLELAYLADELKEKNNLSEEPLLKVEYLKEVFDSIKGPHDKITFSNSFCLCDVEFRNNAYTMVVALNVYNTREFNTTLGGAKNLLSHTEALRRANQFVKMLSLKVLDSGVMQY